MARRPTIVGIIIVAVMGAILVLVGPPGSRTEASSRTERLAVPAVPDPPPSLPDSSVLGDIDEVRRDGMVATVTGWARNRGREDSLTVELLVDDVVQAVVVADEYRPDVAVAHGGSGAHGFSVEVPVEDTAQRICVFTVPDGDLVVCDRTAGDEQLGVLITPTGVVTPILEETESGYLVFTPCAQEVELTLGRTVDSAQIVIDPGHGGRESSTVAANGLMEKTVNLQVALLVEQILGEAGYSVVMTRTTDLTLPIPTRTEIANALDPDIFVSIHHNGGARAFLGRPGTEVYYQHDDSEAQRLAGILYEDLFAAALEFPTAWVGTYLDGATARLHSSGGDFYGIHRRTPDVPSVITEWLWLSNPAEAALLVRPEVVEAEAMAIARGIDRWYRTVNQGSGFTPPFVDDFDAGGGGYDGCVDPAFE